ncbi:MAG: hypothetical protein LBK01_01345, partial [Burkholderiaceae bacterium]|nr:hypothetical protein [Burkholderiaceae bacterium]
MENKHIRSSLSLFHTQVLDPLLSRESIPPQSFSFLEQWVKDLSALGKQPRKAQCDAFLQRIWVDLLGYAFPSGEKAGSLKKMDSEKTHFDAQLGHFSATHSTSLALIRFVGAEDLDALAEDPVALAREQAKDIPDRRYFILASLSETRLFSLVLKRNTYERFRFSLMLEDPAEYHRFYLLLGAKNMLSGKMTQWLHESISAGLRDKLIHNHATLKAVYGPLQSGVPVSFRETFIVSKATRDALINEDPRSANILKPFFDGHTLRKWHVDAYDQWLIYTPKGTVDIADYPVIERHLLPFRPRLEKREGDQKWFELAFEEDNDYENVTDVRVGVSRDTALTGFALGMNGAQYWDDSYYVDNADYFLFGLLNSTVLSRMLMMASRQSAGEGDVAYHRHIESLPI